MRPKKFDDIGVAPDVEAAIEDIVGDLPKLVPLRPAAEALGISHHTLRTWIREHRVAAIKTAAGAAGRLRVPRTEIARLLRAMATC
jgi:excisionase family DNA binding protein